MKWITLILVVLCLSGCALMTSYEHYAIRGVEVDRSDVYVWATFYGTEIRETTIPMLMEKSITKEPYKYYLSIQGAIDDVGVDNATLIVNGTKRTPISITGLDKKVGQDGASLFSLGEHYLDDDASTIETLEVNVKFHGVKNGVKKEYNKSMFFKMEHTKRLGNRFMDRIMSV